MKRGTLKKTVLSIISPNQYSGIDKKEAGELPFDRFSRLSTFKLSSLSNVGAKTDQWLKNAIILPVNRHAT